MLESTYPFTSGATGDDTTDCLYSESEATNVKVRSFGPVSGGGNTYDFRVKLFKLNVSKQPLSVAIAANNKYIH